MHLPVVFVAALALFSGLVIAQSPATSRPASTQPNVKRDVVYGQAAGVPLRLDACWPATPGLHPAVILVHGGAWQAGDKTHFRTLFQPLTDAGYAWFSINYRLAPKHPFPACIEDVETAVKWVKDNAAAYGVDPGRVALLGESAGGHLVELVAAKMTADSPLRPAAVVALYAPADLPALAATTRARGIAIEPLLTALLGRPKLDDAALNILRDVSPLTHVKAGLPPFLLLHGTADQLVPISQSIAFAAALKAVNVPVELITVPGGPHGMVFWQMIDPGYRAKILAFLDANLRS